MDEQARASAEQVADKLYEDIRHFFQEKLPAEQMIQAEVQPVERVVQQEDDLQIQYSLVVTFRTPTDLTLDGRFLITHAGGNVYGVSAAIAERESRTFEISVPDSPKAHAGTGAYTHDLCMFILAEIERITGEHFLRDATERSSE